MFTFPISIFGGPQLLHIIDWTPATFSKTQGVGSLDPNSTASYHWDLEETSAGASLAESLVGGGTHDFDPDSGATTDTVWAGQTASGLCNGSNLTSYKCIERARGPSGSSQVYICATSTTLDVDSESVGIRAVFRWEPDGAGGDRTIISKWDGSKGWYLAARNGRIIAYIHDGTTFAQATVDFDVSYLQWNMVELVFDWTSDTIELRANDETPVSASLSALTQANVNPTHAATLAGRQGAFENQAGQIADVWVWTGSAAEALPSDAVSDFWVHGRDPQAGGPWQLTFNNRTGTRPVVAEDGSWYFTYESQIPIGYHSDLVNRGAPNGFGLFQCTSQLGNECTWSENLEAWTASGITVSSTSDSDEMTENLFGFRRARRLTATSDNGTITCAAITATSGGRRPYYVAIKGQAGGETGRLIIYDEGGASEITSVAWTATTDWIWVHDIASNAEMTGPTSISIKIEMDNTDDIVWAAHAQVGLRAEIIYYTEPFPIPTYGAAVTLTQGNCLSSDNFPVTWPHIAGELDHYIWMPATGGTGGANSGGGGWVVRNGAASRYSFGPRILNDDARCTVKDDGGTDVGTFNNSSGTSQDWYDGARLRLSWNSNAEIGPGYHVISTIDTALISEGTATGGASSWTSDGGCDQFLWDSATPCLQGIVYIWNMPESSE